MINSSKIPALNTFFNKFICGMFTLAALNANADTTIYTLDNIVLDDNTMIVGTFSWTYDVGDFENGVAVFSYLSVPHTAHDHSDLEVTVDTGHSIEITFPGNLHDDGVDITFFLLEALAPNASAAMDLVESRYEIGGNGFHTGGFISGAITPLVDTDGDGISDNADNCTLVSNADQRDTNSDGYGNSCDPDLNNDGIINFSDVSLWAPFFNSTTSGDTDFNGDGFTNFGDYVLYPGFFLGPPGPSGIGS